METNGNNPETTTGTNDAKAKAEAEAKVKAEADAKAKAEAAKKEKREKQAVGELKFADIAVGQIERLGVKELRRLCGEENLSTDGKKEDFAARLIIQKGGITDRYAGQLTRCKVCRSPVRVTGTTSKAIASGTLVIRQIKCRGKHCHTYPLKELERPRAAS